MRFAINIRSKGKYPADQLSNFSYHPFQFYGEQFTCIESFLQSLKFPDNQEQIWMLSGKQAKDAGKTQHWNRYLFFKGKTIDRNSKEYISFVKSAYQCMFEQNPDFRKALRDSKGCILLHTIGKWRRSKTVLTWWEFTHILTELRKKQQEAFDVV